MAKHFVFFLEKKERERAAFGTCIVGLVVSAAILLTHGSGHLLLSYSFVPPHPQVSAAVDAICKIAAERRSLLLELKATLLAHQDKKALALARRYCGIEVQNGD